MVAMGQIVAVQEGAQRRSPMRAAMASSSRRAVGVVDWPEFSVNPSPV